MASVLEHFLCKFRFTRAFLGRRLGVWRPWSDRGHGPVQEAEKAECPSPGTATRLELRERGVAASYIPASASHPSLDNTLGTSQQLQPLATTATPLATDFTVEPPSYLDHANPSSAFEVKIHPNRRSTDSSIRSRSNDRLSIIQTHSHESVHTSVSRPTQFCRDPLHQSGRGPSASPSRVRSSSSPSPTDRIPQPRLEVGATNLRPQTQVDSRNSLVNPPSATPHADVQQSPPSILEFRTKRSSPTSVVVEVENPSTDSLPHSLFPAGPLPEEPYTIGHISVVDIVNLREGPPEDSTTSSSSATSNFDLPSGRFLQLINSEQVPRYTKDATMQRPLPSSPEEMGFEQGSLREDCAPWVPATHPDGALYFFDKARRLFTDTDMHDPKLREEMEDFYDYLQRILSFDGLVIPSQNYDLTLDIMPSQDGRIQWSYYYACHETRCLFWLDPYEASHMISELFAVRSPAHVKHRLEALYWTHWSLFPVVFEGRRLTHAVYDELVGVLSHGCMVLSSYGSTAATTDVMTSKSSTLPYSAGTMQQMIGLVRNAKGSDTGLVYHTASITHWRFLYFHGQNSARLERHKTVYHSYEKRTFLITLLSPVLFLAPEGHLRELEDVWVDEVIIQENWRDLISGLLKEWEQLIIS
ncbi:hypothetical protein EDB87DRAFT_1583109, partial [Lactarius vividus]